MSDNAFYSTVKPAATDQGVKPGVISVPVGGARVAVVADKKPGGMPMGEINPFVKVGK